MADTATVWWIEKGTGELRSRSFGPHDIPSGGTYENEVSLKYAADPVEMTTIYNSRAGNTWEKSAMDRLRDKSAAMRRQLCESGES